MNSRIKTLVFELDAQDIEKQRTGLEREVFESLYKDNSIGIRCPDNAIATMLLQSTKSPVVAPTSMNTKKKIERCLRIAPKPPASGGLLDRLRQDFSATEIKARSSAIRRWFAPTDDSISLWRVAAVAAIGIAVILPLSYGAVKVVQHFRVEVTFDYPEDDTMYGYGASSTVVAKGDTNINTLEDARRAVEEFRKLYREGKAEEVEPGVWMATLSDGEEFAYAGDPEQPGLLEMDIEEANQIFKEWFDEIHELRKAGEYERTFLEEIEKDGVIIRLYRDSFVLSNGKVVTLTVGEEETAENED